jgi:hypothetical protein
MLGAILSLALVGLAQEGAVPLPEPQTLAMVGRMLVTESFVGSQEEREGRGRTGRYFTPAEYARLRGNPVLGYWDVGSFAWSDRGSIGWGGIHARHASAREIRSRAWDATIRQVARKHGLRVTAAADVRVEGACVAAVVDPTPEEPVPGVMIEVRLRSPHGTALYRVAVGKGTVEDAMGAALDLAIAFGLGVGESTAKEPNGPPR